MRALVFTLIMLISGVGYASEIEANKILLRGKMVLDNARWSSQSNYSSVYAISSNNRDELNNCFRGASKLFGIKESILRSIAMVESSNNVYAINVNGKSIYHSNHSEARRYLEQNRNKRSVDVGLMQVNNIWFKRLGYDLEEGLDGCFSIFFGAMIYAYELERASGDIWKAVGRYHSPNEDRQRRYMNKVYREIKKMRVAAR